MTESDKNRTLVKARSPRRPAWCDQDGFSFIEILVAVLIMSTGLLAVASLMGATMWYERRSQDLTNATIAAQQVLERLHSLPDGELHAGNLQETISVADLDYTLNYEVVEDVDSESVRYGVVRSVVIRSSSGLSPHVNRFDTAIWDTR